MQKKRSSFEYEIIDVLHAIRLFAFKCSDYATKEETLKYWLQDSQIRSGINRKARPQWTKSIVFSVAAYRSFDVQSETLWWRTLRRIPQHIMSMHQQLLLTSSCYIKIDKMLFFYCVHREEIVSDTDCLFCELLTSFSHIELTQKNFRPVAHYDIKRSPQLDEWAELQHTNVKIRITHQQMPFCFLFR
jgi:hypothetical protein